MPECGDCRDAKRHNNKFNIFGYIKEGEHEPETNQCARYRTVMHTLSESLGYFFMLCGCKMAKLRNCRFAHRNQIYDINSRVLRREQWIGVAIDLGESSLGSTIRAINRAGTSSTALCHCGTDGLLDHIKTVFVLLMTILTSYLCKSRYRLYTSRPESKSPTMLERH